MAGNVLDMVAREDRLIVSVDGIHKPGSTTDIDETTVRERRGTYLRANAVQTPQVRLYSLALTSSGDYELDSHQHLLVEANEIMALEWHEQTLRDLLYSTESLRKRREQLEETQDNAVQPPS